MGWLYHKNGEQKNTQRILIGNMEGKRPKGHARKRCEDLLFGSACIEVLCSKNSDSWWGRMKKVSMSSEEKE